MSEIFDAPDVGGCVERANLDERRGAITNALEVRIVMMM